MKLVVDTNRYSDLVRSVPEALEQFQLAETIYVPFSVLAELKGGFLAGSRRAENEHFLKSFLASSRVVVLHPDAATVEHYAALFLQLRRQGTPIPSHDMWVAALTLQHGLTLYARDRHFDHIPQLQRI